MAPKNVAQAAAMMGRKSYRVRLERFGIERLREIARQNGQKGGRPRKQAAAEGSSK